MLYIWTHIYIFMCTSLYYVRTHTCTPMDTHVQQSRNLTNKIKFFIEYIVIHKQAKVKPFVIKQNKH